MCVCVWCHLSKVVFETFPTKETRDSDRRISRSISCQSFAKNIFRQSPDSCCETVNISKILKSQETVGGFFFFERKSLRCFPPDARRAACPLRLEGSTQIWEVFVGGPKKRRGKEKGEKKKEKLFDHQRPPQFVLFISESPSP